MDLTGLESLIDGEAKQLDLDREALARLKRRYPTYFTVVSAEPSAPTLRVAPSESMEHALERIMRSEHDRVWTSSELCDYLEGVNFPMHHDRNIRMGRLGEVLSAMVEAGKVELIEKGIGRRPSRYRDTMWRESAESEAA